MASSKARSAKVRLTVVRDNTTRAVLRGVTEDMQRESKRAQKLQEKIAKDAAKAAERAAKATAKAQERAEKDVAKATARTEAEKRKAAAKTAAEEKRASAEKVRNAQRAAAREIQIAERTRQWRQRVIINSARMEERENRRLDRERQRGMERRRSTFGRVGAGVAGAAFGAVSAGRDALGRAQSTAGVDSFEGRIQTASQVGTELIRQSRAAGMSTEQRGQIQERLVSASTQNNIPLVELMAGLSAAQSRFSAFEDFAGIMDKVAAAAAGTGASVEDLVGALGSARESFGLSGDDMEAAMQIMAAAGAEGSIDAAELAKDFADVLGSTQRATGRTGLAGLREAIALAEAIGTGQAGAAASATMQERLLTDLTSVDTQKKLKKIGINTTDASGGMLPIADIAAQFATNAKFQNASTRQDILTDVRGRKAAEILMSLGQKDPEFFNRVQNVTTGQGTDIITGTRDEIMASEFGKLANIGISAQAETMRHAEENIAAYRKITAAATDLQARFPFVSEGLDMFGGALKGAVAAMVAQTILMGGKGFGAVGSIGPTVGGAGGVGKLGTAASVLSAGMAGYELGNALGLDKVGEQFGSWLAGQIHGLDSGAPSGPMTAKTDSTIKVQIEGPGRVTDVQTTGGGSDIVVSNGVRGRNG